MGCDLAASAVLVRGPTELQPRQPHLQFRDMCFNCRVRRVESRLDFHEALLGLLFVARSAFFSFLTMVRSTDPMRFP